MMMMETRIFVNGTARFGRTVPSGQRGPPPEVVPNIPVGPNRNGPFHLTSARHFRKFWLNGKHPNTYYPLKNLTQPLYITRPHYFTPRHFQGLRNSELYDFVKFGYRILFSIGK